MKLKYYLRGLGIGIVLTTLILFVFRMVHPISNEEVIKRAEQLGMVTTEAETLIPGHPSENNQESTKVSSESTSDVSSEEETQPVETNEVSETEAPSTSETPATTAPTEEPTTKAPTTEAPTTQAPTTTEAPARAYNLTITNSMGSESVAYILAREGIVDSAERFNDYLCNYGYSEIILSATFTVTSDMSYEQIARLICGR